MNPSSRTPEGRPHECPVCGKSLKIEPSSFPQNDATCPYCGTLLLFTKSPDEASNLSAEGESANVDKMLQAVTEIAAEYRLIASTIVSEEFAIKHRIYFLRDWPTGIHFASESPHDENLRDELVKLFKRPIQLHYRPQADIERTIKAIYRN